MLFKSPFTKDHDVDVALRIQFVPAISAESDRCHLCFCGNLFGI